MPPRTDPNEPVSNVDKFYGACSVTLRSVYLDQISINGEHVPTGIGPGQIGPEWLEAELTRELQERVPNYDAYVSPFVPAPPAVDQMIGIKADHVLALKNWFAAGRPAVPALSNASLGQGG